MIDVFGTRTELRQSTSSTPGRLCAALVDQDGAAWPDLFVWDPVRQILEWDHQRVEQLLRSAKRKRSPVAGAVLWLTEAMIGIVRAIRALFGSSCGGSLGFGQAGGLVAMMSAALAIVAFLAAAVVLIPLTVVAWSIRLWIDQQVKRETQRVIEQVQVHSRSLEVNSTRQLAA